MLSRACSAWEGSSDGDQAIILLGQGGGDDQSFVFVPILCSPAASPLPAPPDMQRPEPGGGSSILGTCRWMGSQGTRGVLVSRGQAQLGRGQPTARVLVQC